MLSILIDLKAMGIKDGNQICNQLTYNQIAFINLHISSASDTPWTFPLTVFSKYGHILVQS